MRDLHRRLRRLEERLRALAGPDDGAEWIPLPPLDEFRRLPRGQRVQLLIDYDRPPSADPGPPFELDWFESLPPEEMRQGYEHFVAEVPTDEHSKHCVACFSCLRYEDQLQVYFASLKRPVREGIRR
jgi:hypothetical protein